MNEAIPNQLREVIRRRPLRPEEKASLEAWLAEHPGERATWELEEALSHALQALPPVDVPTNFAAQVLAAVDRHAARSARAALGPRPIAWLRMLQGWRVALPIGLLGLGFLLYTQQQVRVRTELARSLTALPAAPLADVEVWKDFDSIYHLPQGPLPSVDRLAAAFE